MNSTTSPTDIVAAILREYRHGRLSKAEAARRLRALAAFLALQPAPTSKGH